MTTPRSHLIREGEEGFFHCRSRCVRRAHLCGTDYHSGKCFDHRREWIRDRLKFLVEIFAIEVLVYSLLTNHMHTLLHTMPHLLSRWSDEEIARRRLTLFPKRRKGRPLPVEDVHIRAIVASPERVAELRRRLGSVSWFMKSLNEFIARRANKEDECTGCFWEGRFKCSSIEDDAGLLACSVYIDLNPIRSRIAASPEGSDFTSIQERIQSLTQSTQSESLDEPDLWIAPIFRSRQGREGFLPITLLDYMTLVDSTGRMKSAGKRGVIPAQLPPILDRLRINPSTWDELTEQLGRHFPRAVGNEQSLVHRARSVGQAWFKGVQFARAAFG